MEKMKDKIYQMLNENAVNFKCIKHPQALTAEMGEKVTGFSKDKSIKSLIIKGKKSQNNYLVAICGHDKIDRKALALIIGEDWEFEDLHLIQARYQIVPGGAHPFGNLLNIVTIFDEKITHLDECIMGTSISTESIVLKSKDLIRIVQPKIVKIVKD
jgi:hypothetical protein